MNINKNILGRNQNCVLRSLILFSPVTCLIFSSAAFADTPTILASNNQIIIRTNSTKVAYTESGNGLSGTNTAALDTETGNVPGYAVLLSTMNHEDYKYFAAEYDKSSGQTTYTGSQQGGVLGSVVNTSSLDQTNYYVRIGKGFSSDTDSGESLSTPDFYLGTHRW